MSGNVLDMLHQPSLQRPKIGQSVDLFTAVIEITIVLWNLFRQLQRFTRFRHEFFEGTFRRLCIFVGVEHVLTHSVHCWLVEHVKPVSSVALDSLHYFVRSFW